MFSCLMLVFISGIGCAKSVTMNPKIEKKCVIDKSYREGVLASELANKLIQERKFLDAIELLDKWIGIIGQTYYYEGLEDDSEQKFLLSKFEKEKGAISIAANLKLTVLTSRLIAYRTGKLHCSNP